MKFLGFKLGNSLSCHDMGFHVATWRNSCGSEHSVMLRHGYPMPRHGLITGEGHSVMSRHDHCSC